MKLSPEEASQFIRLHQSLLFHVNQRLKLIEEAVPSVEAYAALPLRVRFPVHEAMPDHPELIDDFVAENPFHLDEGELGIVRSWKHGLGGTFYAFRPLKDYMIFLSSTEPVVAYGVVALTDPFEEVLGPYLPRMVKTTLLPFKGRIVYGGVMTAYNVTFGPGIRRSLNDGYKEAKASRGIITTLPPPAVSSRPAAAKAPAKKPKGAKSGGSSADAARAAHDRIIALIDDVCRKHLNEEYATLGRKLAGVLARKRPSPLIRGKAESWASGIIRVIGWNNFLNDPSQPGSMLMSDIDRLFGVSEATGAAKAAEIRRLIRFRPFDHEWTLPSRMGGNPMAWMIQVNGLTVDARHLSREIQEEAYRRGLIPYIPGDRGGRSGD